MVLIALGYLLSALASASGLGESVNQAKELYHNREDYFKKRADYWHEVRPVIGVNIAAGGSRTYFNSGQMIETKILRRISESPAERDLKKFNEFPPG